VRNFVTSRAHLWAIVTLCLASTIAPALRAQQKVAGARKPVVLMVQREQEHIIYKVNFRIVRDPLRAMGEAFEKKGRDCPVVVLLDWDSPVSQIFDAPAFASKAGFKNIRTFIFDSRDRRYMSEVEVKQGVPFTVDPPAE
jgi:hypothetical protein